MENAAGHGFFEAKRHSRVTMAKQVFTSIITMSLLWDSGIICPAAYAACTAPNLTNCTRRKGRGETRGYGRSEATVSRVRGARLFLPAVRGKRPHEQPRTVQGHSETKSARTIPKKEAMSVESRIAGTSGRLDNPSFPPTNVLPVVEMSMRSGAGHPRNTEGESPDRPVEAAWWLPLVKWATQGRSRPWRSLLLPAKPEPPRRTDYPHGGDSRAIPSRPWWCLGGWTQMYRPRRRLAGRRTRARGAPATSWGTDPVARLIAKLCADRIS